MSINAMILVGASGKIFYLKTSSPGSKHDSSVLKASKLFEKLHVEGWTPLTNGIIAADSGYAGHFKFMATPFADSTSDPREKQYNRQFCRARVAVEQSIGRLKNRWRILLGDGIRLKDMEDASKTIQICGALQNMILEHDSEPIEFDEQTKLNCARFIEPSHEADWDVIPDSYRSGRLRKTPTKEKLLQKFY